MEYVGKFTLAASGGFAITIFAKRADGNGWDARVRVDSPLADGSWRDGIWTVADAPKLGDPEKMTAWNTRRGVVFRSSDLVAVMKAALQYRADSWQTAMENAERWRRSFIAEPADVADYERAAAQAAAEVGQL